MLVYMSLSICSSRGPYCADLLQALFDSRMLLTTLSTNNNGLDACHTMLTCAFLMTSYSRCDMMSTQDYYQHGSANSLDFHENFEQAPNYRGEYVVHYTFKHEVSLKMRMSAYNKSLLEFKETKWK